MKKYEILWVDDEIELLKPHIMFLEEKGYNILTSNNGIEGIEMITSNDFDAIFLDENMPGLSGLETLSRIKIKHPSIPIVMITKSEEESIMEDAIGSNIADYLIKPVNPRQILLCLKKILDNKDLISKKTTHDYQIEFRNISTKLMGRLDFEEWKSIYKDIVRWELELEKSDDSGMLDILYDQKKEANTQFSKFIKSNYLDWLDPSNDKKPILSHTFTKKIILPEISEKSLFYIVIDNLRYDQWKIIQTALEGMFKIKEDDLYFGILPTATQYARNALFAGLLPSEINKKYPQFWTHEHEDKSKNNYESELLNELLKRFGIHIKHSYNKVLNLNAGKKLIDQLPNLLSNPLNVIVYNFVDMLSHARTDMEVIKELANDETAYRSLTLSWFEHSPLFEIFRFISEHNCQIILTTDHGSIRVKKPIKVIGEKNTTSNLRYKVGRNLNYNPDDVFEVRNPNHAYLPSTSLSSSYIFCKNDDFFAYPNNFNYYVNYYNDTFQHGGISMEEMMIPFAKLIPK